jgi:hypothetical protein
MSDTAAEEEIRMLQAALTVLDFTVYFCSQFAPSDNDILKSQIKAAEDAYREVTGEEPIRIQLEERRKRREQSP